MSQAIRLRVALAEFARTLAVGGGVDEVLEELAATTQGLLDAAGVTVCLVDESGGMRPSAAVPQQLARLAEPEYEGGAGPCREAVRLGTPVLVDRLADAAERWPDYAARALDLGIAALAAIPLQSDGPRGCVTVFDGAPRTWTEDDIGSATALADMGAGFVRTATELERRSRTIEQLQHALSSRVVIEQAKGIVAAHRGVPVGQAFQILRRYANDRNVTLRAVAEAVVDLGLRP